MALSREPEQERHVERFNRTVQEPFVDYHEDLLFRNLEAFNRYLGRLAGVLRHRKSLLCPQDALLITIVSMGKRQDRFYIW